MKETYRGDWLVICAMFIILIADIIVTDNQQMNKLSQQMSGMKQSIEMQISEMPITQGLTIQEIADKCDCYICENGNGYCKILNEYYK